MAEKSRGKRPIVLKKRWELGPLTREILGIALAGVSAFALLAIATGDERLMRTFGAARGNWMGPAGAWLRASLDWALGYASYVLPCLLAACAALVIRGYRGEYELPRLLGIPLLLVALAGILDRWGSGGAIGLWVKKELAGVIGRPGAWLVFLLAIAIGLMVSLKISLVALTVRGIRGAAAVASSMHTFAVIQIERRHRERERRRKEHEAREAHEAKASVAAEAKRSRRGKTEAADAGEGLGPMEDRGPEPSVFPLSPGEAEAGEPAHPVPGPNRAAEPSWLEEGLHELGAPAAMKPAPEKWEPPQIVTGKVLLGEEEPVVPAPPREPGHAEGRGGAKGKGRGGKEKQVHFEFWNQTTYQKPPIELLDSDGESLEVDKEALIQNSEILEKRLLEYGVPGKVTSVTPGPVITRYDFEPAAGVKVSKIMALADDITLAMRAISVRILAPVPGKAVVGIEIPNRKRETVYFKDVIASPAFQQCDTKLTLALGKDIAGNPFVTELPQMPHLLVAGTTGSGKSVTVNAMICSVLYKSSPDEVKLILIDPKMLEFAGYDGIPHLMLPIVTDMRKAAKALRWATEEMEGRYHKLATKAVRNIEAYNQKIAEELKAYVDAGADFDEMREEGVDVPEKMKYIMVIIDELSDLMMVAGREVEELITRLAQMARAAGIHLLVATQRPSVDVLTGVIKANFPARIAFKVATKADSRVILDQNGAERLLGKGDMLFLAPGTSKLQRIHGAYISDAEIKRIVEFLKKQGSPVFDESVLKDDGEEGEGEDLYDEKYDEALAYVSQLGHASISLVQRRFRIGYNRAARIIEKMEREGILGPADGSKPRPVLVNRL